MCYGVFGGKGTLDALREWNGQFLRLNLSSSTLCLLGVLFFLVLILLLCLIIVIFNLDVILSMYTPGVPGTFD